MCEDKKNPIADIAPQTKKIFENSKGKFVIDVPKYNTRIIRTIRAGKPNNSSERERPAIYVSGETGDATNTSCILYSVL
jgi:hypothetical protein